MRRAQVRFVGLGFILVAVAAKAQNTFPATGNVGIGTTSPANSLQVSGGNVDKVGIGISNSDGSQTGLSILGAGSSGFGISGWANAGVIEAESPNGLILGSINSAGNGAGGPITFQINRSPVATISTSGRFGIGTSSPTFSLDVAGKIRSSTGGIVFPDGSVQVTAFNPAGTGSASAITENNGNVGIAGTATASQFIAAATSAGNGGSVAVSNGVTENFLVAQGASPVVPTWPANSFAIESGSAGTTGGLVLDAYGSNPILLQTNRSTAMTISGGSVGIGTTSPGSKLEVSGNVKLTSGSGASMTFQDGSVQTVAWNGVLGGGDYAESVDVIGDRTQYEPGDVLVIDPSSKGKFMKSTGAYSTAVMGIYSTRPGVVGRRQLSDRSHMKEEVPMAMVGVVPTKVSAEGGAISSGDLLVTSSKPGYAMKGTDRTQLLGAIIGKALEPLDAGLGVIEVAVSIQ